MRILYHYTENSAVGGDAAWRELGVDRCFLKYISYESDCSHITKKRHYHSDVEIHIVERGSQIYEIGTKQIRVAAGSLLWIAPGVEHATVEVAPDTVKYAICFRAQKGSALEQALGGERAYDVGRLPAEIMECIGSIVKESQQRNAYYRAVIRNRMLDCVVHCIRMVVDTSADEIEPPDERGDERLAIAKQYIEDNIRHNILVSEVAAYCYIGEKQLARIFRQEEGVSVAEYIRKKRCLQIEKLLSETALSLCEIGEAMGFRNEYYFNAFCKKYVGLPPGAYRRAILKK